MPQIPRSIRSETTRQLSGVLRPSSNFGRILTDNRFADAGNRIAIGVSGERALTNSLRVLARGGDPRGIALQEELRTTTNMLNRSLIRKIRDETPVGQYRRRRRGQRRLNARDNTRYVSYGPFAKGQQPGGLLRKSVRVVRVQERRRRSPSIGNPEGRIGGATGRKLTRLIVGSPAAFYIRPLITKPSVGDFIGGVVRREFPRIIAAYERAVDSIAADFTSIWGNRSFKALSREQQRLVRGR